MFAKILPHRKLVSLYHLLPPPTPTHQISKMAFEQDIAAAETQLKAMTHSEQHYFNRFVKHLRILMKIPSRTS